jgi:hypothetical protein
MPHRSFDVAIGQHFLTEKHGRCVQFYWPSPKADDPSSNFRKCMPTYALHKEIRAMAPHQSCMPIQQPSNWQTRFPSIQPADTHILCQIPTLPFNLNANRLPVARDLNMSCVQSRARATISWASIQAHCSHHQLPAPIREPFPEQLSPVCPGQLRKL